MARNKERSEKAANAFAWNSGLGSKIGVYENIDLDMRTDYSYSQ